MSFYAGALLLSNVAQVRQYAQCAEGCSRYSSLSKLSLCKARSFSPNDKAGTGLAL